MIDSKTDCPYILAIAEIFGRLRCVSDVEFRILPKTVADDHLTSGLARIRESMMSSDIAPSEGCSMVGGVGS